jgi:HEAT repeat protein
MEIIFGLAVFFGVFILPIYLSIRAWQTGHHEWGWSHRRSSGKAQISGTTAVWLDANKSRKRLDFSLLALLISTLLIALSGCISPEQKEQIRIETNIRVMGEYGHSSDADPWAKSDHAMEALVEIGEPAVEPLIEVLKKPATDLQFNNAVWALARIGDPRAIEPLFEAYQNSSNESTIAMALITLAPDDPRTFEAAIQEIGSSGSTAKAAYAFLKESGNQEIDYWVRGLTEGRILTREYIFKILHEIGCPLSAKAIAGSLVSDNEEVVMSALVSLNNMLSGEETGCARTALEEQSGRLVELSAFDDGKLFGNKEFLEIVGLENLPFQTVSDTAQHLILEEIDPLIVLDALVNNLSNKDPNVVLGVLDILKKMLDSETTGTALDVLEVNVDKIIPLLDHDSDQIQEASAWLLTRSESPNALEALYTKRNHPLAEVRKAALWILVERVDPRAGDALMDVLLNDPDVAQAFTLELIGIIGSDPYESLVTALQNKNADTRALAASALGKLGKTEAIPLLGELVTDTSVEVRSAVTVALGELKDSAAVPFLEQLLFDAEEDIQNEALAALESIGTESAVTPLISTCRNSSSKVREQSCWILSGIDRGLILPLLDAIQRQDLDMIAEAYSFYIAYGEEGSEPVLIKALMSQTDKSMATAFLNCGNPLLEQAAKDWAKANRYTVISLPGSGGNSWGGGK